MRAFEFLNEAEGTPEGVPHLTKELLKHIVQQVGTEGAHAIVKSLEWGDGAAKELLHLIVQDLKNDISMEESVKQRLDPKCWKGYRKAGTKMKGGVRVNNCVKAESLDPEQAFDIIEEGIERIALAHGVDPDLVWEDFDAASDEELYMLSEDWQKVNKHDKTDGLSRKAVSAYRREHPGSKLKTAVTTKPSKLKKGSKSAKRRKSFCARMSGMKKHRAGAKTKRDPNSPINKALRRWNC